MLWQIVTHTPLWVWAILLALLWLGSSQLLPRVTSFGRVLRVALGMSAFSVYGIVSAFGTSVQALACWLGALVAVGWLVLRTPMDQGVRYLPAKRAFALPGSWIPLALTLGVFAVKYVAGVAMAMRLPLIHDALFIPVLGLIYGAFSGAFLGRAGRLVQLARRVQPQLQEGWRA